MPGFKALMILVAATAGIACAPPGDASEPTERFISVNGTGRAGTAPDTAVLTLGVETQAATAAAALADNNGRTRALLDALRAEGVAEKHLQTQAIQLQALYEHDRPRDGRPGKRHLVGYQATNVVSARLTEIDKVGQALDAAVNAGGNRVDSIRFEISDPTEVLNSAREAAWQDAYGKARQLAELAGASLGPVLAIESYERTPGPVQEVAMARSFADTAPVQGGTQVMAVNVQVRWALQ